MAFIPRTDKPGKLAAGSLWFAFSGNLLVVSTHPGMPPAVPVAPTPAACGLTPVRLHYMGDLNERPCYAVDLAPPPLSLPAPLGTYELRSLFGVLDDEMFAVAGRAAHLLHWERTHQFCSRCGVRSEPHPQERAKFCPACGLTVFPRIQPAVIVAVRRGDRLLLAHNSQRPDRMFSVIAGFVEVGETLEHAVQRELREEVSIEVRNIRYFGSQPWPYPDSLMLGFTAEHASGEIRVDGNEISEADWFTPDAMPEVLPGPISISRALIDAFIAARAAI